MNQLIYVVGDRVRMRYPASNASNGTVTLVFRSVTDYYDVKFDAMLDLRVCYAGDMEYSPEAANLKGPFWN